MGRGAPWVMAGKTRGAAVAVGLAIGPALIAGAAGAGKAAVSGEAAAPGGDTGIARATGVGAGVSSCPQAACNAHAARAAIVKNRGNLPPISVMRRGYCLRVRRFAIRRDKSG